MSVSVRSLQPLADSHGRKVQVLEGPVLASTVNVVTLESNRVFHIASPEDAKRLRGDGVLAPPSLQAEGFVHCSTAGQVVATTERYFPSDATLVLIELDPAAVGVRDCLRWPEVYPGECFPHLHGPLVASAVVAVHPWGPDDRARW